MIFDLNLVNYHCKLEICPSATGQILSILWGKLFIGALIACFSIIDCVSSNTKAIKTSMSAFICEIFSAWLIYNLKI